MIHVGLLAPDSLHHPIMQIRPATPALPGRQHSVAPAGGSPAFDVTSPSSHITAHFPAALRPSSVHAVSRLNNTVI